MTGSVRFLEELAARRRFGMKPGLGTIRAVCAELGDPQDRLGTVVHVAGTNGKGAVCAMLDACLAAAGLRTGRYTSPHLVSLNERFFLGGAPVSDALLEESAARVGACGAPPDLTFFEALTAVAFDLYARARPDVTVLETGLGGRLDATNVCRPALAVITRIGLDHCDWLGDTVERIAAEKAGIVKPGVPVVLGKNGGAVRAVVAARAREVGAPFVYAPEVASEDEIPSGFSLGGSFNRENAVTALAALKILHGLQPPAFDFRLCAHGFARVVWPGRFQRLGGFLVDGAHNPPAARALAAALAETLPPGKRLTLVAGFCGDKDVASVLGLLKPFVARAFAVKTCNPRSLAAGATAERMRAAGLDATPVGSLGEALAAARALTDEGAALHTLVCGSLFLAGEAAVALGGYPWAISRGYDPAETLCPPAKEPFAASDGKGRSLI